ncbi:hypothetical protein ON010_g3721 [Phytophthora cinnamomi]|nr:hypothetical protein ON010_g3721 [Phytophthora cinnamomi]
MAVNAAAVQCLDGMARVARAVGDWESANAWVDTAASVKTAINELLWNDTLGNSALDVSTPEVHGVSAIAFALSSGVVNETQIKLCVEGLEGLRQGPGYLDSSTTDNRIPLKSRTPARLGNLWDAMISNKSYRTGASWEYVAQPLEPGIDFFTSLSHPWGGTPTYALTNYIAGIRPVEFGFRRWIVNPLVTGLNVTSARATLRGNVTAPVGTDGVCEVAQPSSLTGIYEQHLVGTGEAVGSRICDKFRSNEFGVGLICVAGTDEGVNKERLIYNNFQVLIMSLICVRSTYNPAWRQQDLMVSASSAFHALLHHVTASDVSIKKAQRGPARSTVSRLPLRRSLAVHAA